MSKALKTFLKRMGLHARLISSDHQWNGHSKRHDSFQSSQDYSWEIGIPEINTSFLVLGIFPNLGELCYSKLFIFPFKPWRKIVLSSRYRLSLTKLHRSLLCHSNIRRHGQAFLSSTKLCQGWVENVNFINASYISLYSTKSLATR